MTRHIINDGAAYSAHETPGLIGYAVDYYAGPDRNEWRRSLCVTLGYSQVCFLHSGRITNGLPGGWWAAFRSIAEGAD